MSVTMDETLVDLNLWTPGNYGAISKLKSTLQWQQNRPIYVFDMDGTICNSDHRHHFLQNGKKDWAAFFAAQKDDDLYIAIAGIMEALLSNLNLVVILTARPEDQRAESVRWLEQWPVPYHAMFMRPENNRSDDNKLKPAQLHTYLGDRVSLVRTVFEDRRRTVHSLREHGFHVCHVAEGDF